MRKLSFVGLIALAACAGPGKDDAKGQVDDSEPPSVPGAVGKGDSSAKVVATNVQSPHPYGNNLNRVYPVSLASLPSCASSARLHFKVLRTEANYDFVTVEPTVGVPQSFDGNRDNVWTSWFELGGASVNVRLETDGSITRHGFEIDQIEWSGAPICPAVVWPACGAGTVDVAKAPGTCQCPVQPVCKPIADVEVSHYIANGRNRTTKRTHGADASYTHPGPTDGPVTDDIGTVDTVRLAALVRRAAQQGLLQGPGYARTVTPGAVLEELTIKAGTYTVTFSATQGSQDPAVQSLIDELEALFACDAGGGLTCGSGYECAESECVVDEGCVCPALYDPVCGTNGHTYGNACQEACANAPVAHDDECGITGDACGGFAGLACGDGYKCRYGVSTFTYPHPDAGGTCVAGNYCDAPADCNGLPHAQVLGAWACNANACAWQAGPQWRAVTDGHFETTNPYTNNMSVWKELYLPAEAQALRLRSVRFKTENNYDKLEVWSWKNGAWVKVKTYTGSSGPSLADEWPGQYHYLRFVSDSSVTDQGVSLDAEWR